MKRALALLLCCTLADTGADSGTTAIGIKGRGFVVVAADAAFRRGPTVIAPSTDPFTRLGPWSLLVSCGDVSTGSEFASYVFMGVLLWEEVSKG